MGGGASSNYEDGEDDSKPLVRLDINGPGGMGSGNVENLEAAGAAQWHRILKHTKEKINEQTEGADDANAAHRAPKTRGKPTVVDDADAEMVAKLLDKGHHKKTDDLTKLGLAFAEKEQLEQEKQRKLEKKAEKEAKKAANNPDYDMGLMCMRREVVPSSIGQMKKMSQFLQVLVGPATKDRWTKNGYGPSIAFDPDGPRTIEDEEFRPEIELPEVKLQLKSRTSTSITVVYDIAEAAFTLLQSIRDPKDSKRIIDPLYQFEARLDMSSVENKHSEEDDSNPLFRWK